MGYTTYFDGQLDINPPLNKAQVTYINQFSDTRRMKRDPEKASKLHDPLREAVGLPIGEDGAYYVGGRGFLGQDKDDSVIDHNRPPVKQPGLWCQWVINEEGTMLQWDHGEKFYEYTLWLEYLIEHFFQPWGISLKGSIDWSGEDGNDRGTIYVHEDGRVEEVFDEITNSGPSWRH